MSSHADDLAVLIANGRSARADWLSENASRESIAATLAAMANSHGGTLLLGVLGASIVGVQDGESAIDRVLQAALAIDPPLIIPMPRMTRVKERPLVVVHIPRGMPHVYAYDGRYLYRSGAENTALKPRETIIIAPYHLITRRDHIASPLATRLIDLVAKALARM